MRRTRAPIPSRQTQRAGGSRCLQWRPQPRLHKTARALQRAREGSTRRQGQFDIPLGQDREFRGGSEDQLTLPDSHTRDAPQSLDEVRVRRARRLVHPRRGPHLGQRRTSLNEAQTPPAPPPERHATSSWAPRRSPVSACSFSSPSAASYRRRTSSRTGLARSIPMACAPVRTHRRLRRGSPET